MANKTNSSPKAKSKSKEVSSGPVIDIKNKFTILPFTNFWIHAAILVVVGFALYWNTFDGEYALDDGIVIEQNQYVQCGFDSVSHILSKDAYHSFYKQMGSSQQLSGGRYRPLSMVTFAIEQSLFADSVSTTPPTVGYRIPTKAQLNALPKGLSFGFYLAGIRHIVNVILYVISIVVLFYFLRTFIFKTNTDLPFFVSLLFLAHPIHTEVVANVKSRDEILSFLFITLTFIFLFRYIEKKKALDLIIGMFSYFMAFLAKEYALVLIPLFPIAVFIFYRKSLLEAGFSVWPLVLVFVFYFVCRINSLANSNGTRNLSFAERLKKTNEVFENPEVLNNPYIYANKSQKGATKMSTISNYFKLTLFPHPLSSDYSYNQIPYKNWGHYTVWLSLLLHGALVYFAFKLTSKRHVLGFAIMNYLGYLAMVGNILMDIGATMGERLIYHSSLGFCIALAWFLLEGISRLKTELTMKKIIAFSSFAIIISLYGFKTVERNEDWHSDITLFTKDVETVPNSVLANGNAGARCIDMADLPLVLDLDEQMVIQNATINFKLVFGYIPEELEKKSFYDFVSEQDKKMIMDSIKTKSVFYMPMHFGSHKKDNTPFNWRFAKGDKKWSASADKRSEYLNKAIVYLNKALKMHPKYVNGYLNLGLANYKMKNLEESDAAWAMARKYFPNNPYLRQFQPLLSQEFLSRAFKKAERKDFMGALQDVTKATELDPGNYMNFYHLGGAYYTVGNSKAAYDSWQRCLQLNPNYEEARKAAAALQPLLGK